MNCISNTGIEIRDKRVEKIAPLKSYASFIKLAALQVIALLLWGCSPSDTPSPDQADRFIKIFGGANNELAAGLSLDDDGGYRILGTTYSTEDPMEANRHSDIYIVKTNVYGDAQWSRRFDFQQGHDFAHDLTTFGSHNILLASATDTATDHKHLWVLDLDFAGASQTLVDFTFSVEGHDFEGASILPLDDGVLILGTTTWVDTEKATPSGGFVGDSTDIFLAQFSLQGDTLWSRRLGFEGTDRGVKVLAQAEGGYVFLAQTDFGEDPDAAGLGTYLAITNSFGVPTITRRIEQVIPGDLQATADGGYVMIGTSYQSGDSLLYLAKLNPWLELVWTQTYEGLGTASGRSLAVVQAEGSGERYLLGGHTRTAQAEDSDLYLTLVDESGVELWTDDGKGLRTYGGPQDEICRAVKMTDDGGFAVLSSQEFGETFIMNLLKVNAEGRLDP